MRAVRLVVEPFAFLDFIRVVCIKELDQHGRIQICGTIEQQKQKGYLERACKETWVNIKVQSEQGEVIPFFTGILTALRIKQEGRVCLLTIEVKTGSFMLDIKKHIRSFQDPTMLYAHVLEKCMGPINGKFIMLDKKQEQIGRFLLQYEETDWEFIKRIATYAGTVVMPESATPGIKIYLGYRQEQKATITEADQVQVEQGYGQYEKRKADGAEGISPSDAVSYRIRTRELYDLGMLVGFDGRKLVVKKITSWFEKQELYHEYQLVPPKAALCPPFYDQYRIGLSLKAFVTAVERTKVQIKIQKDENDDDKAKKWFDHATVYSTPDGTGWYCMPEVGDVVRMVLPDQKEENAYVASSVHLDTEGGRSDPNRKSWKNKQNKEIVMSPDSIILQNNNGLLFELSDKEGIKMISDKNILMQSMGDVVITSQEAGIKISAKDQVLLKQSGAKIQIKDTIDISGGKIYMN